MPAARSIAPPALASSKKDDGLYCYWRRSPHHPTEPGYIKTAPAWASYHKKITRQKWEDLADYGEFEDKWESGTEMVFDPFRHILLSGGGKEFPIAQIRELRWHRFPPVYLDASGREIRPHFPQLEGRIDEDGNVVGDDGLALRDFRCPDCAADEPSSWFLSEVGLRKHQRVQHSEIAGSRQQANDFAKAIQGQNQPIQDAIGLMSQLLTHLTEAQKAQVMAQLETEAKPTGKAGKTPAA